MKKFVLKSGLLILSGLFLFSCSTSNEVVSGKIISKRKHNKGFHINWPSKVRSADQNLAIEKTLDVQKEINEKENLTIQEPEYSISSSVDQEKTSFIQDEPMGGDRLVERSDVRTDVRNERVVEDFRSEDTENHVVQNHEKKALKLFKKKSEKQGSAVEKILLIILCFLIPFVAVGIVTDWSVVPVVINILLCILFFLPGIIHALWHVLKS